MRAGASSMGMENAENALGISNAGITYYNIL